MREIYNYEKQGQRAWSYKRRKNICTNAIRSANHYHKDLINENVNNPRQFWKNIKEIIPKNTGKITSSVLFIKYHSASDNNNNSDNKKSTEKLSYLHS